MPTGAGRAAGPFWAPTTSRGEMSHSVNEKKIIIIIKGRSVGWFYVPLGAKSLHAVLP